MWLVNSSGLKLVWKTLALAAALHAVAPGARAVESTAFELMKEGDRQVPDDARGRVLQIRSEKSTNGLTPHIWCIVYCDARMKTKEVKFDGGKMLEARRPFQLFARAISPSALLDSSKLKVDSDKALKIAQNERLLDKVKLTNSRMTLEKWEEMPVWKIHFWTEKSPEAGKADDVGEIFVSAEDGKVVNRDLNLDRNG
jgi:hypothetical protein